MNVELQTLMLLDHKDYCNSIADDMETGKQQAKCSKSIETQRLLDHINETAGIKVN